MANNDKAIEFESRYRETMNMIENLRNIGVTGFDIDKIQRDVDQVKAGCKSQLKDKTASSYLEDVGVRVIAEQVYGEGIGTVLSKQTELTGYNIYFTAYYNMQSIKNSLEDDFTNNPEQIKAFARSIIILINSINNSDTRFYDTEQDIVEDLYHLAYLLMKKEMALFKSSTILSWAKKNYVVENFLNDEIKREIAILSQNPEMKVKLDALVADCLKNGITSACLSEELVSYVALYSNVDAEKLKNKLDELYQKIEKTKKDENSKQYAISELKERKKIARKDVFLCEFMENVAILATATAACIGIAISTLFWMNKDVNLVTYRTYKDIHSTSSNVQTPNAPEYMELIEDGKDTVLIEYGTWHSLWRRDYNYAREVYTYDLSPFEVQNYEDYLNIDYKAVCERTGGEEFADEVDKLYHETIIEIVHYTQDMNDIDRPNEPKFWGPIFLSIFIDIVIGVVASVGTLGNQKNIVWLKNKLLQTAELYEQWKRNVNHDKSIGRELKAQIEELRQICKDDKKVRQLFIDVMKDYGHLLPDDDRKEKYMALIRTINNK